MKHSISLTLILLSKLFFFGQAACATEVLVLGNESMPWNGIVDGKDSGIMVDILNEATRNGAPKFKFRLGMPWARAQIEVLKPSEELVAIIPLTRNAEREAKFKWIAELVPNEVRIVSYGRPAPITSLDEAKNLSVGLILGHAAIPQLKQSGFTRIDHAKNAESNERKLFAKRIDALIDSRMVYRYHWKQIGQNTKDLQEGPVVGEVTGIYIAGAPDFPDEVAKRIADALEKMRKSGKLKEIFNKWE